MNEPNSIHHHHQTMMHGTIWQPPAESQRNTLFKTSVNAQVPLTPQGRQNGSLSGPNRNTLMIAEKAVFGNHQVHFDKGSSKTEKISVVAGEARTLAEQAITTASYINVTTWGGDKLTNGGISADRFTQSFQALGGINVATQGLAFIKSAGETSYHTVKDITFT
ncbi:hypothetical protein ACH42_03785 [Endozoicomonas sp. (ex Bugula neritina AB1)]|nr:hypothetical protein ACH42_03785 [Endozoicomonas sp. (ex Bugula neritina AB1)]